MLDSITKNLPSFKRALLILSCLLSFPLNDSLAQNQSPSYIETLQATSLPTPNELLIRLRPDISQAAFRTLNEQFGAEAVEPVFPRSTPAGRDATLNRIYLVRFPTGWPIEPLIKRYRGSRFIEAVEPNYLNRPLGNVKNSPNDPRFSEQWNLLNINMPGAYAIERGNPSVIIAVVDSGIDLNHEDLRSQLWRNPREIPGNGIDDDNNGYVDDIVGWDFSDAPTLPGRGDYTEHFCRTTTSLPQLSMPQITARK
ncbi:hypothetical protein HYR99_13165 [Candidatus Poribacteria bacterium]|nr:hypothetical protein [Candidatus Poribacteria bacterium]